MIALQLSDSLKAQPHPQNLDPIVLGLVIFYDQAALFFAAQPQKSRREALSYDLLIYPFLEYLKGRTHGQEQTSHNEL